MNARRAKLANLPHVESHLFAFNYFDLVCNFFSICLVCNLGLIVSFIRLVIIDTFMAKLVVKRVLLAHYS